MIVRDLDIVGIAINKTEADAPLVVDSDRMIAFSVSPRACGVDFLEEPSGHSDALPD